MPGQHPPADGLTRCRQQRPRPGSPGGRRRRWRPGELPSAGEEDDALPPRQLRLQGQALPTPERGLE